MSMDGDLVGFDFAGIVENTPNCVAVFDKQDCLIYANCAFREAFFVSGVGVHWSEIMRDNFKHNRGPVIETDDIESWLKAAESRRGTDLYRAFEVELHGGVWLWITETMYPDGQMLLIAADISRLRPGTRSLRQQRDMALRASFTDELTDVPNRRYVLMQLEEWRETRARSNDRDQACIALIDIDRFKPINDTHGHEIGDKILVAFCEVFLKKIRLNDLFGGEEFILFMPHCGLNEAERRISDIASTIRNSRPIPDRPDLRYSFSAGLLEVSGDHDIEQSLKRADELLYRAKEEGRDRVAV